MTTPYIIHQMWGTTSIREPYATYHRNVKLMNPGATVNLWTDATMIDFMTQNFPQDLDWYNNLPLPVHRWDVFRYFLLFTQGGMYLDMDMEPTRSFKPLFDKPLVLCSENPKDIANWRKDMVISNAMMISEPQHPFMATLIEAVRGKVFTALNQDVLDASGPGIVTDVWEARGKEVTPLSYRAFYPHALGDRIYIKGDYATHQFSSCWWKKPLA